MCIKHLRQLCTGSNSSKAPALCRRQRLCGRSWERSAAAPPIESKYITESRLSVLSTEVKKLIPHPHPDPD